MERVSTFTGAALGRGTSLIDGHAQERALEPEQALAEGARHRNRTVAVIPAYNEDRFIGSVLLKIRPYVDWAIVVDDGSSDRTSAIAREAGAEVITHCVNQGKAKALESGFARALELEADVVVTIDADGQHDPSEIPGVVQPIVEGQADMVIGSRFRGVQSEIPIWRIVGQHGLTLVTNLASGVASTDSQSGFRAFRAAALQTLRIRAGGFSIESELQFWASEQKLRVAEAPISVVYVEKPKRNPVQQALQVLNGIFGLVSQSRPLLFFGVSGLLVALLGVAVWYRIVQTYDLTRELDLLPVMLATLCITIGILATFQGITLHTMRRLMLLESSRIEVGRKGDRVTCGGDAALAGDGRSR